ncbi:Tfp pilus assembly protein PilN [Sphingomonas zeicaulis]|uniref:hypothetical protein n=1 Tax=Sphingomonas zeicaulis TaxID=1632740 RepID=UPI003D20B894
MVARIILLAIGAVLVGLALIALYRSRQADCLRLQQTAELALDAQIRPTFFGGCHVVAADPPA